MITDLGMPHVDGRKVAAAVKTLVAATPVIMLTGWGQRMLAEGDIPAHVDRVLSKPPRLQELRIADQGTHRVNTVAQCRLLIVDDEVAQMKALCNTLEMEGYATTGYSSPRQALASLRAGEVDLLLTDLMMPEMDGISLLKAAREVDGNLAGIVMTGQGTIDTAVKAMQHGALDYILKPFKLSAVLTVLARAREVRQLRLDNAALQDRERGYIAELEAANKDLDAFSYSVSHDLRAPLRAITGFCEIYLSDYGQDVPAAGRQLLDRVVRRCCPDGPVDRGPAQLLPLQPPATAERSGQARCHRAQGGRGTATERSRTHR